MSGPNNDQSACRDANITAKSKVPDATASFWLLKLLTTALGEAASDFVLHRAGMLGAAIASVLFIAIVTVQMAAKSYRPVTYWVTVAMVAIWGTMAADAVHHVLGVPLGASTLCCAAAVGLVFVAWRKTEGTLSIHSITSVRREAFYWFAVSTTFALGTAAGDYTAFQLGLGFLGSTIFFFALILLPPLMHWRFGLNSVVAFWWAYILTRPLGASIADWLGKPRQISGLGIGDQKVAACLLVIFSLALVATTFASQRRRPRAGEPSPMTAADVYQAKTVATRPGACRNTVCDDA